MSPYGQVWLYYFIFKPRKLQSTEIEPKGQQFGGGASQEHKFR
jgi:hypothetical protein